MTSTPAPELLSVAIPEPCLGQATTNAYLYQQGDTALLVNTAPHTVPVTDILITSVLPSTTAHLDAHPGATIHSPWSADAIERARQRRCETWLHKAVQISSAFPRLPVTAPLVDLVRQACVNWLHPLPRHHAWRLLADGEALTCGALQWWPLVSPDPQHLALWRDPYHHILCSDALSPLPHLSAPAEHRHLICGLQTLRDSHPPAQRLLPNHGPTAQRQDLARRLNHLERFVAALPLLLRRPMTIPEMVHGDLGPAPDAGLSFVVACEVYQSRLEAACEEGLLVAEGEAMTRTYRT